METYKGTFGHYVLVSSLGVQRWTETLFKTVFKEANWNERPNPAGNRPLTSRSWLESLAMTKHFFKGPAATHCQHTERSLTNPDPFVVTSSTDIWCCIGRVWVGGAGGGNRTGPSWPTRVFNSSHGLKTGKPTAVQQVAGVQILSCIPRRCTLPGG